MKGGRIDHRLSTVYWPFDKTMAFQSKRWSRLGDDRDWELGLLSLDSEHVGCEGEIVRVGRKKTEGEMPNISSHSSLTLIPTPLFPVLRHSTMLGGRDDRNISMYSVFYTR